MSFFFKKPILNNLKCQRSAKWCYSTCGTYITCGTLLMASFKNSEFERLNNLMEFLVYCFYNAVVVVLLVSFFLKFDNELFFFYFIKLLSSPIHNQFEIAANLFEIPKLNLKAEENEANL